MMIKKKQKKPVSVLSKGKKNGKKSKYIESIINQRDLLPLSEIEEKVTVDSGFGTGPNTGPGTGPDTGPGTGPNTGPGTQLF